jgi:hypothetical protein
LVLVAALGLTSYVVLWPELHARQFQRRRSALLRARMEETLDPGAIRILQSPTKVLIYPIAVVEAGLASPVNSIEDYAGFWVVPTGPIRTLDGREAARLAKLFLEPNRYLSWYTVNACLSVPDDEPHTDFTDPPDRLLRFSRGGDSVVLLVRSYGHTNHMAVEKFGADGTRRTLTRFKCIDDQPDVTQTSIQSALVQALTTEPK